jgi:lysophospholipase L1-like esterase
MNLRPSAFWRSVCWQAALMGVLIVFQTIPLPRGISASGIGIVKRTVRTRGLSAEAREAQAAGYYQELLNGANNVVVATPMGINDLVGGPRAATGKPVLEELAANQAQVNARLHSFLVYRPLPNLDLPDPRFGNVRTVTNSLGFSDREYPLAKTPGTRRLVWLGDSLVRSLGVPPGEGFESLLEAHLNQTETGTETRRFELINMGVSGYRITQIVDIALEDAARFQPDAYVVVLSWLTVAKKWGLHLAQLVEEDIDPKYDFLRDVIAKAHLKKGDSEAITQARLGPFVVPTVRWALGEIRAKARSQNASVVVLMLPHLKGIGSYEYDFGPIRTMLQAEQIPFIDMLDVFDGVDVAALDVGDGLHANARGQRMLFERLYREISSNQQISAALLGPNAAATTTSTPKP